MACVIVWSFSSALIARASLSTQTKALDLARDLLGYQADGDLDTILSLVIIARRINQKLWYATIRAKAELVRRAHSRLAGLQSLCWPSRFGRSILIGEC